MVETFLSRGRKADRSPYLFGKGGELEPGVAFRDGQTLWLGDGCHRHEAYLRAGRPTMPVTVRNGTRLAAMIEGVLSNKRHNGGLWTREDNKHAVEEIIREHPEECDRSLAALVGCSPAWVGKIRA